MFDGTLYTEFGKKARSLYQLVKGNVIVADITEIKRSTCKHKQSINGVCSCFLASRDKSIALEQVTIYFV